MRIRKINPNDIETKSIVKKYCIESIPIEEISIFNSVFARSLASDLFINNLFEDADLSLCSCDNKGVVIFFAFFINYEDNIELRFASPNTTLKLSPPIMRQHFYNLCLYAVNYFKNDRINGKVYRVNKRNGYKLFLVRYIKAITYVENDDKDYDDVYLTKESILDHCEKLKTEGNWN